MSANSTPKQGDHVFNEVGLAIMRPFDTVRSLGSTFVQGNHFLYDFMLHSFSFARSITDSPTLSTARNLTASADAESDALRQLLKLQSRYPAVARATSFALRDAHLRNADRFGSASQRFEREVLTAVRQALESALSTTLTVGQRAPNVGIAGQQMLGAAYDPAAALVVIAASMDREATTAQSAFSSVVAAVASTLDQPGMWKDPYSTFREDRASTTGKIIGDIRDVLYRLDLLKTQIGTFGSLISGEINQKSRSPQSEAVFGAMLPLLQSRLQGRS